MKQYVLSSPFKVGDLVAQVVAPKEVGVVRSVTFIVEHGVKEPQVHYLVDFMPPRSWMVFYRSELMSVADAVEGEEQSKAKPFISFTISADNLLALCEELDQLRAAKEAGNG